MKCLGLSAFALLFLHLYLPLARAEAPAAAQVRAAKTRDFLFTYAAILTGLKPGEKARIWLPVPPSNADQQVEIVSKKLPTEGQIAAESKYGNKILYVGAKASGDGTIPLSITYRVKRREVIGDRETAKVSAKEKQLFLKPDAKVPIGGKPATLLEGKKLPQDEFKLAKVLYHLVNNHMEYSKKGTGWGQGDAVWACDSHYGNCSDFHSLFISLARTQKIPARFEIGFSLPEQRGKGDITGYHCWAKFNPQGHGWIPVDISEANRARAKHPEMVDYYFGNLTENRITFSEGRDLTLVPPQDGPAVNFLVYPYVEVNGQPYPADKVQTRYSFEDVK